MTTEKWREEFRKLWGVDRGGDYWNDPECSALQMIDFIYTLLSKERNEAMKLNYWDKEKRNEVIDEVKNSLPPRKEPNHNKSKGYNVALTEISTILENLKVK